MAGDEDDVLADEPVGDGDGLFWIAGVIADLEPELLAENAAGGVDVRHRHLGAALHLFAEGGVLAGHRTGDGDDDFRLGLGGGKGQARQRRD